MPYGDYDAGPCRHCGEQMGLQWANGGRYKQYCNDKCRKAAQRQRQKNQDKRQAVVRRGSQAALLASELQCDLDDLATGLRRWLYLAGDLETAHWRLGNLLRTVEEEIPPHE